MLLFFRTSMVLFDRRSCYGWLEWSILGPQTIHLCQASITQASRTLSLSVHSFSLSVCLSLSLFLSHTQPAFVITVVKYPVCIFPRCFFRRPFTAEECIHHRYALKAKFFQFLVLWIFVQSCRLKLRLRKCYSAEAVKKLSTLYVLGFFIISHNLLFETVIRKIKFTHML